MSRLKTVRVLTLTEFCKKQYLGRSQREQGVRFLAGLRRSLTCLWAKYLNSHVYLINKIMKYMIHITLQYVFLASFLACLAAWLINSLLVYGFFACNYCQLWMNFKVIFCWYMVIILCIFVLIYLWFSSCLAYECIPFSHQTL